MERIVVGVDGSAESADALRWAVAEADVHQADLVAVLVWSYLDQHHAEHHEGFDASYGEEQARAALHTTIEKVAPDRPVGEEVVCDLPARGVLGAAADADLIVVGARGLGGFKGLLLGSVSEQILEYAEQPVAVVRDHPAPDELARVIAAVDGSPTSIRALRWAAAEATAHDAELHVVHTWHLPYAADMAGERVIAAVEDGAREVLDRALADPALSDLDVEGHLLCSGPASAVLELARPSDLVVTGSRGRGRLGRALLGSTSRQLAHHVPCPIVVLPTVQDS